MLRVCSIYSQWLRGAHIRGAVPLSAAGWQQSTAVSSKLKFCCFFFSPSLLCLGKWLERHFGRYPSAAFACSILNLLFFLQLYLFCICKVIKLNNVCASIGSTEKKPSRDLVSHTQEKKKRACTCVLIDWRLCKLCVFALVQKPDKYFTDMVRVQMSKVLNQIALLECLFLSSFSYMV